MMMPIVPKRTSMYISCPTRSDSYWLSLYVCQYTPTSISFRLGFHGICLVWFPHYNVIKERPFAISRHGLVLSTQCLVDLPYIFFCYIC